MKITLDDIRAREPRHVLQTYKRQPVVFVRGSGSRLYDADGREYLDLVSGHRRRVARPRASGPRGGDRRAGADAAPHVEPVLPPVPGGGGGRGWRRCPGLPRAFFCNSGTEANEACLKFARRYWHTQGATDAHGLRGHRGRLRRPHHGRAVGHARRALSPPVHAARRAGDVRRPRPAGRARRRGDRRTAAIIAEPIRGEGGVRPLSPEFAQAIAEACRRTGTLLIADEVQSGLGRTGLSRSTPRRSAGQPDLISVGKALGSGVPVGAALVSERVAETISAGRSRQHLRRQPARARARRRSSSSS